MPGIPGYQYVDCKFTVDGPIATFMWSNPRYRNAYSMKSHEGLQNCIAEIKENDDIGVLVMTGDPEGRNFCGGLNVKSLYAGRLATQRGVAREEVKDVAGLPPQQEYTPGTDYHRMEQVAPRAQVPRGHYKRWRWDELRGGFSRRRGVHLLTLDKPTIAMVNGPAFGFGCDLIFYNDIIIASEEKAEFEWTYIHRGMVPAEGATYFLPRIAGRHIALEVCWLGSRISARQAYEWGLINHVVPDAELKDYTYNLATRLATECPPMIMGAIKYVVHMGMNDFVRGLERHLDEFVGPATQTFRDTHDAAEGMKAFVEKRAPKYTGI